MTVTTLESAPGAAVDYDPFAGGAIARAVPTTESQREVWLADRLGREASLAFNESICLRIRGAVDAGALRAALADVVGRHEALRGTFGEAGETFYIADDRPVDLRLVTETGTGDDPEGALAAARRRVVEEPFDLVAGPLLRAELHRLSEDDHALLLTAHHIVCDGWSFGVIVRELAQCYDARRAGGIAPLGTPASFGDYATDLAAARDDGSATADESYWIQRFAAEPPGLDLPLDRPRPAQRTLTSRREDRTLDASLVAQVRKAGARQGASLFSALLAAFAVLLNRLSGANDVVIGVPAAGQMGAGRESLVGHCVNLLPLRIAVDPATPVAAFTSTVGTAVLDAYEHQGCTFGTLLRKLAIARDASRLPLVGVMFNLDQSLDPTRSGFAGLDVRLESNPRTCENFELFVNAVQRDGGLTLECQYNADLFEATSVRRWLACYEEILRAACASPDAAIGDLPLVPAQDLETLARWNDTARPYDRDASVHGLFERQAARSPARTAVRFRGAAWTYGRLDSIANAIARDLASRGVRPGDLVGVHLARGPAMIAALLGVLKAGAGYVPLDPTYPEERLRRMAQDAALAALVTGTGGGGPAMDSGRTLRLEDSLDGWADRPGTRPQDPPVAGDGVAYVIYTSGSTGVPKGVRVPHRAVANFLASMAREPGLGPDDRVVAVTTLSFDIAVNEILLPLSVGAEVVLASEDEAADGGTLARLLASSAATVLQATPATWRLLLEAGWRGSPGLRAWCGGEALAPDLARSLLDRTGELWNLYGPTETTVWSTCARVTDVAAGIRIGRPIANTAVWVLDERRAPCPVGVPGEIWIGGDGVTLGYHERPDLTAERFPLLSIAGAAPARYYRTGDRGRWRDDGMLEHLGRLDHQVKVRGYRIELGEIEAALAAQASVAQALALVREDRPGDVRLVGYVVPRTSQAVDEDALKSGLRLSLPEYMIPQHLVALPAIPRLPNGKVDRRALPAPKGTVAGGREYVAPRDELETLVAREMEAALGMPGLGVHDDFFRLGGHSLLAAQLTARLNRAADTRLTMRAVFAAPTIGMLAGAIREQRRSSASPGRIAIDAKPARREAALSLMQERLWYLEELNPGRVTYNAPSAHRLRGPLDEAAFARAFDEMVRRQPILRTSFEPRGATAVQRIHEHVATNLFPAEDLSALPAAERESVLARRLESLTAQTFDLTQAPLFKAHLFRLAADEHVLFFMPHHIVWDGWSFDVFYEEFSSLYAAFCEGRPPTLPALAVTYGDFAEWHRAWTKGPEFESQRAFWRARLDRLALSRALPTDRPRRPGMSGAGDTAWMHIGRELADDLHALGRRSGATMFVTALAAYCVLLQAYGGQDRLVVGAPVRGRNALELEPIMGYFNNLVPLPIDVDPEESFLQLIERVKAVVVECFACPDVPLEDLAGELAGRRPDAGSAIYQALFSFQDARQRTTRWGTLEHENIPLFQKGATEDLGLWFVETAKGLHGGITYNTDILEPATAARLHDAYLAILAAVARDPGLPVARLAPEALEPMRAAARRPALAMPPAHAQAEPARATREPATETEEALAAIWRDQLKIAQVHRDDNFFDLGGHSLLAVQAILAMEARTGRRIDRNRYIFETLEQIARAYDEAEPAVEPAPARAGGLRGFLSGLVGGRKS